MTWRAKGLYLVLRALQETQKFVVTVKYILGVLIFLHAILHFLGFLKAFSLVDLQELTLSINRSHGIAWLIAGILLLCYLVLFLLRHPYSWVLGFVAITLSMLLIIHFWKDAKFGMLPNLVILSLSVLSLADLSFNRRIQKENRGLLSEVSFPSQHILTEAELSELPVPVKRWLRRSGVIGKPYIKVARVVQQAEMKMRPGQKKWMTAKALQYSNLEDPAFLWTVDVKMNSLLNLTGRDKFISGKGGMLIMINSLFPVVTSKGEKIDEGSLQRFLGEMVWFPSLAVSEHITWEAVNDTSAIANMAYGGITGSGTFFFNEDGDFTRFSALRFKDNDDNARRYPWVLEVQEYRTFEGIRVPSTMTATWKLEDNDWTWLRLKIEDIAYNESVFNR